MLIEVINGLQSIADDAQLVEVAFFDVVVVENCELALLKNLIRPLVHQREIVEFRLPSRHVLVTAYFAANLKIFQVYFVFANDNKLIAFRVQTLEPAKKYIAHAFDSVGSNLVGLLNCCVGSASCHGVLIARV